MKRLNPATNLLFKRGDVREDGYIFYNYSNVIKKNGYYKENWFQPEKFKKYKKQVFDTYTTIKGRACTLLANAKTRAKKDKAEVSIDIPFIIDGLQRGTCELTGILFDLLRTGENSKNLYGPSLDRRDSKNKNYTKENTRIVLYLVNNALNEFTEEQALPILKAMVKAIEEKHARQDTATPVPEGAHSEGQDDTTHWAVHGAWPREDSDSANDHRGEPEGEDTHRCTEEGSGVGVGSGVTEVESFEGYETLKMYGFTDDEIRCVIQAVGDHDSQPREPSVAP
jgi:hypothetical protein